MSRRSLCVLCSPQNAAVFHGADVQHLQTEVVVHQLHAGPGDACLSSLPVQHFRREPAAPLHTEPPAGYVWERSVPLWVWCLKKTYIYIFLSTRLPAEPLVTPPHVDRLSNLKSLAMDFCDFTSDLCRLLASPRRTPLHRLSLVLNGPALGAKSLDRTPTENDWKTMVSALFFLFFFKARHHVLVSLQCDLFPLRSA